MIQKLAPALSGLLFGLGLTISQMINPEKVTSFLDVTGDWDPSLALVLFSAVGVAIVGFSLVGRRETPLHAVSFELPKRTDIDARLVFGAAIFGIGWGLVGYCPGPAIAALTTGSLQPVLFVVAMLCGSLTLSFLDQRSLRGKSQQNN